MGGREVVRLGLFPELDYYQPPNLLEDAAVDRKRIVSRRIGSERRNASITVSPRTISPSTFSSRDMKDDVLAVLRKRFPSGRSSFMDDGDVSDSIRLNLNGGHRGPNSSTDGILKRKRSLEDESAKSDVDDGCPKAKQPRKEAVGPDAVEDESGHRSITNGTSNGGKRSLGLFESDEVDMRTDISVSDGSIRFTSPVVDMDSTEIRTGRSRPIYGRRTKLRRRMEEFPIEASTSQDDDEERRDALAAFKAGQEYELRKIHAWVKASPRIEIKPYQPPLQPPPTTSSIYPIGIALPTTVMAPPKTTVQTSVAPIFPLASTTQTTTTAKDIDIFFLPPAITTLAPATTVTWSTSLVTPILAVQPFSTPTTSSAVNEITSSKFQPTQASGSATTKTTTSDVFVNVTIPLPSTAAMEPSTSLTMRLPTISSSASGYNLATNAPTTTSGFNFSTRSSTVPAPFNFSAATTTSGFNFAEPASTSTGGFNFAGTSSTETTGFNFTFTGQPVSTGQFSFATLDPSTNIFSAVHSGQTVAAKRKAGPISSYMARRRQR